MKKWGTVLFYFFTISAILMTANWGSKAVTTIAENAPVERTHRIVIDPGHGGEDGGATSCTGMVESRYNLEISLRLNDLLHLLGYETVMTRTTDTAVYTSGNTIAEKKISDLRYRVKTVNAAKGALLLSIHQNNFSSSQYSGAQVFYASSAGSKELAEELQSLFVRTINPGSRRKCKKSEGIYLMSRIQHTGILIECGFLSNPAEESLLRNIGYQQKLCCVIASAVSDYLSNA